MILPLLARDSEPAHKPDEAGPQKEPQKELQKEAKKNSFYGLPLHMGAMFKRLRGIGELYDWQDECLRYVCWVLIHISGIVEF